MAAEPAQRKTGGPAEGEKYFDLPTDGEYLDGIMTTPAHRTPFSASWLWVPALVTGLVLVSSASGLAADKGRGPGEKIEFTPPPEAGPVRPLQGFETEARRFGVDRRETSVNAQLPGGTPLPAPDDVNRLRLLQQLLDRRSGMSAGLPGDQGPAGVSLDDPEGRGMRGGTSGIEDLFDRNAFGGERRNRDAGGRSAQDRAREDSQPKDVEGDRERSVLDNRSSSATDGTGQNLQGRGQLSRERRGDDSFLPSLDNGVLEGRDEGRNDRAGRGESFLDPGGILNRRGASRDLDDSAAARRNQRAEEWNKLLGRTSTTPDRGGVSGGAFGAGGLLGKGVPGATAVPGMAVPGGGPSRNALEMVGARAPEGIPGDATSAVEQPLVGTSRLGAFDLGLGRTPGRSSSGQAGSATSTPRAMELFRQKHDSSIPTRGF
jgi:hypothetical protein